MASLAFLMSGCLVDNPGPALTIINGTPRVVTIIYRHAASAASDDTIGTMQPGSVWVDSYIFRPEGRCLHGTVLAVDGSVVVDQLANPCQGDKWTIGSAPNQDSSPSGAS